MFLLLILDAPGGEGMHARCCELSCCAPVWGAYPPDRDPDLAAEQAVYVHPQKEGRKTNDVAYILIKCRLVVGEGFIHVAP